MVKKRKGSISLGKDLQKHRGGSTPDEGTYLAQCISMETLKSEKSGKAMIVAVFQILEGDYEGKKLRKHYFSIEDDFGMEQLAGFYFAVNPGVERVVTSIHPDDCIGKRVLIDLMHEEYEGRTNAKIKPDGFDVADEAPKKKKKKSPAKKVEEEEEDEDEGEEGDEEGDDEDEEEEEEPAPKKKKTTTKKTTSKKKAKVEVEAEDEDDEEEEEDGDDYE